MSGMMVLLFLLLMTVDLVPDQGLEWIWVLGFPVQYQENQSICGEVVNRVRSETMEMVE